MRGADEVVVASINHVRVHGWMMTVVVLWLSASLLRENPSVRAWTVAAVVGWLRASWGVQSRCQMVV